MNTTDELGLPAAPPLPPDVRDRALRTVLAGMAGAGAPVRNRARRWAPLLTAAAVVLVAVVVALVALPGARSVGPGPSGAPAGTPTSSPVVPTAASTTAPAPLPADELPAPSGDPATDAALARCATAVVRSGRAAEYPPTSRWRATMHVGTGAVESELTIDDAFGCLLTPASVVLSGTPGTPERGVRVVGMAPAMLVVLNPQGRRFTIGSGPTAWSDTAPVTFLRAAYLQVDGVPADAATDLGAVPLAVEGGYQGPVGQPEPALTHVDRALPHRADTPDGAELGECLALLPAGTYTDPDLWMPVARHEGGGSAPPALVARIGDLAAGYCIQDPAGGPSFTGGPLPPGPDDAPRPVVRYQGGAAAILLTAPPGVTRMSVVQRGGPGDPADCTIADGLAMCTLDDPLSSGSPGLAMEVTAFTAAEPAGLRVYEG